MKSKMLISGLAVFALSTGCATTGLGAGEVKHADDPVAFQYTEPTPEGGRLKAVSHDGEKFEGRFVQLTEQVERTRVEPIVMGGSAVGPNGPASMELWAMPADSTVDDFIKLYTGRVVAWLQGDQGHNMRCSFTLANGDQGMKAGGSGECRLDDGRVITAVFPSLG